MIPDHLLNEKSKYRAFLQLLLSDEFAPHENLAECIYFVYRALKLPKKFSTLKLRRFLMHLIGHHAYIIQLNTAGLIYEKVPGRLVQNFSEIQAIASCYMNHSCRPNIAIISYGAFKYCITIRPIKKGEQLFVSYFRNDSEYNGYSYEFRQKHLYDVFRSECECKRCCLIFPSKRDHDALKADKSFHYFMNGH